MRHIHIVFKEPTLPYLIVDNLSDCLKMPCFSIGNLFRKQLEIIEDDLTLKIRNCMNQGRLPDTHFTIELIRRQIQNMDFPDFLLSNYPKTLEEYEQLLDMLHGNNYCMGNIWYFKHSDSLDYFQNYYEDYCKNPENKGWLEKFGDDIEERWFRNLNTYSKEITELYNTTNPMKWRIIEVAYSERLTFLSKIDDSLENTPLSIKDILASKTFKLTSYGKGNLFI